MVLSTEVIVRATGPAGKEAWGVDQDQSAAGRGSPSEQDTGSAGVDDQLAV